MRKRSRKQRSNRRRGKRGIGLIGVVNKVRSIIRKLPPETLNYIAAVAKITLGAARRAVQGSGGRSTIILPKVIPHF